MTKAQLNPLQQDFLREFFARENKILANKLCALLSRSEIRDLVDVRQLEAGGFDLKAALSVAARKDTGLSAAQLAWVLHQIELSDDLQPPGGVTVSELRDYLNDLITRLQQLAFPVQTNEKQTSPNP